MSENLLTRNIKTWKLLHMKISRTTVVDQSAWTQYQTHALTLWDNIEVIFLDKRTPFLITYLLGVVCVCLSQTSQCVFFLAGIFQLCYSIIHNFPHLHAAFCRICSTIFCRQRWIVYTCVGSQICLLAQQTDHKFTTRGRGGWVYRGGLTMVNWLKWQPDNFCNLTDRFFALFHTRWLQPNTSHIRNL